jgi:hypothetical protein
MNDATIKQIEELISKSASASRADDAMKFAQAALNAANAYAVLQDKKA